VGANTAKYVGATIVRLAVYPGRHWPPKGEYSMRAAFEENQPAGPGMVYLLTSGPDNTEDS
jgi:hypothetical protein